tara:strand:+ start:308 stop:1012 length:705 start_codon:yes stop_codon:yes gene_type:complete
MEEEKTKKLNDAWSSAVSYKNLLWKIGNQVLSDGSTSDLRLSSSEVRALMPKRKKWSFRGVHVDKFIVSSLDTLDGVDLAYTDGFIAVGPVPTETFTYEEGPNKGKTGKEVLDKSGTWGGIKPISLTSVCPELIKALCGDLSSLRELRFAGLEWTDRHCRDFHVNLSYVQDEYDSHAVVNPVMLFAGYLHANGRERSGDKDISSFVGYQSNTDDLGPIVVLGDSNYSVIMPIRQ